MVGSVLNMKVLLLCLASLSLLLIGFCHAEQREGFGGTKQDWGHVTVRTGAHMFWWLYYTTADVPNYTDRPLAIWLQGGPGASSSGYGNFEELGPLDLYQEKRNHTWVKDMNVVFFDNPVGAGFSYVDDLSYLTTDNSQIANDLLALLRGFYNHAPEFKNVPLHIFSESYGGKMAAEFAWALDKEIKAGGIECDLQSVTLIDAWMSPIDSVLSWAPFLKELGFVDVEGYEDIHRWALKTKDALDRGKYAEATDLWGYTEQVIWETTHGIDFYNVLVPIQFPQAQARTNSIEKDPKRAAYEIFVNFEEDRDQLLDDLMNLEVKTALGLPEKVVFGSQSSAVFRTLGIDFMKPVTNVVELLLNKTEIHVVVVTGVLDLIVATPGTLEWVDKLQWPNATYYRESEREGLGVNGVLEGYYKTYDKFSMYWALRSGHMVPADNPAAMSHILRSVTTFG